MAYSLIWLPQILRDAGLKVAETQGWADRGRGDMGKIRGVMCHHTGTGGSRNMPSLNLLMNGRGGAHPLSGPLSQLGLARDGTIYVIAAGRANHAGAGEWGGVKTGNTSFIGIEAENAGTKEDEWPVWQLDAYKRCVAAILKHVDATSEMCCGHKEYAKPSGRKIDPMFDMNEFRSDVKSIMQGISATRPIVPALDMKSGKPTLERGARGPDVEIVQRVVGAKVDGIFGPSTEKAVRQFQISMRLRSDGIVGPRTWGAILSVEDPDDIPDVLPVELTTATKATKNTTLTSGAATLVPPAAMVLLQFIGQKESGNDFGCLYGHNEKHLSQPLTEMTLDQVISAGPSWSSAFRSSACGAYQFMNGTLKQLKKSLKLSGNEVFDREFQNALGYALLKGRGYTRFVNREMSLNDFALGLAKEWASLPVLEEREGAHRRVKRGQAYYSGDGLNKALISPEAVEEALRSALSLVGAPVSPPAAAQP